MIARRRPEHLPFFRPRIAGRVRRFAGRVGPAFLLSAGTVVAAAPVFEATEREFLSSLPIVLTPSRLPQPLDEAPAAVTVIDRELIRATGYRDLPRLLRLVPGMQVGQERGGSHWVTYHGMGNDTPSWMQVLVDGRSVYSPGSFDGVHWTGLAVATDEIERIEIVRGTNSAAYGANAFLGVINIVTRHSADRPGKRATVGSGTAGIGDATVELSQAGVAGGLRLNAAIQNDDGFAGLHDARRSTVASLRGDRRIGDHDELMLRVAASRVSRGLGYPDSVFGNNAERQTDTQSAALHVQWRHAPAPGEEWLVHYYRNQDWAVEEWTASALLGAVRADVPLDRNRRSVRDNLEVQHRLTLSETLRAVWGGEARRDRIESAFLYFGAARQESRLARLFGQAEWWFRPEWSLNASTLVEKFDGDVAHVSPRLFVNWKAGADNTLRIGYARAWRQPFMFERHGDVRALFQGVLLVHPFLPNPDLRAPRMDSFEIGYLGRSRAWDTQIDLRLFSERISDYIVRVSHPEFTAPLLSAILPSARYENLAVPVTLRGLEYQIDSRPRPGTRLLFSHTLIDRRSHEPNVTRLTAPYSASLSWMQDWDGRWSSTLTLLRMGPLAGGTGFVPMNLYASPPYTTADVRLARRATVAGTPLEFAVTGINLGPRHQEIADRSEQSLHGTDPVNRTSPMLWLSLSINPD